MTDTTERSTRPKSPPRRVQLDNAVSVVTDAPIDAVWAVVHDVTRVGEWSGECVGAEWLDGATAAVPGARFRGRNRAGHFKWGRVCEVVSAEPYTVVWRTVPSLMSPDSTEWRITVESLPEGTRISQEFHVVKGQKILAVIYGWLVPAHRDRTEALTRDLERLGAVAGGTARS